MLRQNGNFWPKHDLGSVTRAGKQRTKQQLSAKTAAAAERSRKSGRRPQRAPQPRLRLPARQFRHVELVSCVERCLVCQKFCACDILNTILYVGFHNFTRDRCFFREHVLTFRERERFHFLFVYGALLRQHTMI